MLAERSIDTAWMTARGWATHILALTLVAACSSSGDTAKDASSPDASADDGPAAIDADDQDVAPDVLAHDGTVRGGAGGISRDVGAGGSGGDGDAAVDVTTSGPPPANDTCATAQAIVLDHPHVDVAATRRGALHDLDLGCGASGGDVFFSFTLPDRELVYADTFGAASNTVLAFVDGCADADAGAPALAVCNDDACGTTQSQAVALLPAGQHFLVVSSSDGADVTIHLEHAPAGGGAVSSLAPGSSTASGTTSGTGRLSLCEAGGPENSYWWTACNGFAGGMFTASTCSGTAFDSILALQIPRTAAVVCDDDSCMQQASISTALPPGAGLHVLTVDSLVGHQQGAYTLTTVRP